MEEACKRWEGLHEVWPDHNIHARCSIVLTDGARNVGGGGGGLALSPPNTCKIHMVSLPIISTLDLWCCVLWWILALEIPQW